MSRKKPEMRVPESEPVNTLAIHTYLHCGMCLREKPPGISPRTYARFEVGWTDRGLQMWCVRHEANIVHIDFEGQVHPANTSRALRKDELS